ncbi:MAG TPA: pilus assembly protein [Azonexus sp.]
MTVIGLRTRRLALVLASLFAVSASSEDIDLYATGGSNGTAPNVLIFLDNTSNWSSNAQSWTKASVTAKCGSDATCLGYVETIFGANVKLTQGQVEVGALKLVLNALVCDAASPLSINAGLMILPPTGSKGTYSNDAGTTVDNSGVGGVIKRAILPLVKGGTACANLVGDLNTWYGDITASGGKADSAANYGGGFFEAFKYFGGYTNPAGAPNSTAGSPTGHVHFGQAPFSVLANNATVIDPLAVTNGTNADSNYVSPITNDNSCGANYILLVGNTWPNSDTTSLLKTNLAYNYSNSSYPFSTGAQPRIGDAWANFLSTTDVSSVSGRQPVYTYAMNVYNASADASQTSLLKSIARYGGGGQGGYYEVNGDLGKLIAAFTDFFTTISAKNSVFASSSLPVSVNTQGTYLNQVFIGMFRPDANAYQRWAGNLKQYRFGLDTSTNPANLYLADSTTTSGLPTPAIDNTQTGFIKSCATSYWTTDSGTYWNNVPVEQTPLNSCASVGGSPISPSTSFYSDLQDGNLVEKGGIGQGLRARTCLASNVSGTAGSATGTYCGRNIKTCADVTCSSLVAFNHLNISSSSLSSTLVNWVAGGNLGDGPATSGVYQTYTVTNNDLVTNNKARPTAHGDVVHSRPIALNYAAGSATDADSDIVVYYGAGDGMLHAVDGNQPSVSRPNAGSELWAFVAPEFFSKFTRLRDNSPLISYPGVTGQPKDYFFDGGIGAYQERSTTTNDLIKTYIFPSMRRGGRMIYGFNATTKPSAASPPTLMWKFGCPNATNDTSCQVPSGSIATAADDVKHIGQTWSTPRVVRLKGDSNLYVVFGAGYDTCEDTDPTSATMCSTSKMVTGAAPKGTGIYVLNAETGALAAYLDLTATKSDAGRVAADVVPVDTNFDGYTDVLYAVDTRGYAWRINTSNLLAAGAGIAPASWSIRALVQVSNWSDAAQQRKLMNAPDVVVIGDTSVVLFGSGNREQPRAASTAVTTVKNRFYGIRDVYASTTATMIDGRDCDEKDTTALGPVMSPSTCELLNTTTTGLDYSSAILTARGWVRELTAADTNPGTYEQVVTTPATVGGVVYFSTFQPTPVGGGSGTCGGLGTGYGYAVDFLTGNRISSSGEVWSEFSSEGIPPSPVAGIVSVDGKSVPFLIGGKPPGTPGCESALEGCKVPLSIIQRRTKVYRYQKIDTK